MQERHTDDHEHDEHSHDHGPEGHSHDTDHQHDHDEHDHDHETEDHDHGGHGGHGHEHGKVDADLYGNRAGLRAVQLSTAGMLLVSAIQFAIALTGGSAGLL